MSFDSRARSYWLQVKQAGHWRNLEQVADAGAAMIRTGDLSQAQIYDAVRLLEGHFRMEKGQTEFREIVTFDLQGAHFAAAGQASAANHIRMDLLGTISPLLPDAADPSKSDAAKEAEEQQSSASETPSLPVPTRDTGSKHGTVPTRNIAPMAPREALQKELFRGDNRSDESQRRGPRSRLMTGVMVGAFAVGVAVSALAPEQSAKIAAIVYGQTGLSDAPPTSELALAAPTSDKAVSSQRTSSQSTATATSEAEGEWLTTSSIDGTTNTPQAGPTIASAEVSEAHEPSPASPPVAIAGTATGTTPNAEPVLSGLDLETENRQPSKNLVAAAMAIADVKTDPPQTRLAAAPQAVPQATARAPMTDVEAQAMQASLPLPIEGTAPEVKPLTEAPVQVAVQAEEPLKLVPGDVSAETSGNAFTTATAGDPTQLTYRDAHPRPPQKPAFLKERAARQADLAEAIENGSVDAMMALLSKPAGTQSVASLAEASVDITDSASGQDLASLIDFALLQGRPDHVRALFDLGGRPSSGILAVLKRSTDMDSLKRIAPVLPHVGIDPDRLNAGGMTPLMQAAYTGDADGVAALLALGGDPAFETGEGLRAADYAARAKHVAVQEQLTLATDQALYAPIMFGLTWSDTLDTVKDRSSVCKTVGEGFVACSLKAAPWLDDTAAVVAQFDTRNGNRLVAIQVDSHLYNDADDAEVGFKKAAQLIAKVLPPDQFGFPVKDIPPDAAMFDSLTPGTGAGQYFQYWPDDNLKRPVYVHMKMIGYKRDRGFNRIVIGNPFRVG